jgi:hypothetical protein
MEDPWKKDVGVGGKGDEGSSLVCLLLSPFSSTVLLQLSPASAPTSLSPSKLLDPQKEGGVEGKGEDSLTLRLRLRVLDEVGVVYLGLRCLSRG